jgi:hypothetical protein
MNLQVSRTRITVGKRICQISVDSRVSEVVPIIAARVGRECLVRAHRHAQSGGLRERLTALITRPAAIIGYRQPRTYWSARFHCHAQLVGLGPRTHRDHDLTC